MTYELFAMLKYGAPYVLFAENEDVDVLKAIVATYHERLNNNRLKTKTMLSPDGSICLNIADITGLYITEKKKKTE